ncbi:MAG: hypothetical protein DRQ55_05475 [Planctomycetota bacterium]|nr:MAG: hypothetical protein DRQ55_05475 [Planctomycetota bacterium]
MLFRTLIVLVALSGPALAQLPQPQFFSVAHVQSSGWVLNTGATRGVIASMVVEHPAVASLRVLFDEVHLAGNPFDGSGSVLRLTSLRDGAQQTLNAQQLLEWEYGTAWFNGSGVQLDLIASPGTGGNLVTVGGLDVGTPLAGYESQCGPVDDRVPSDDPRVARLLPSGCTAWMIQDCAKCFLSAGHCGTGNTMVEFNVPFSTGSGSWVHPPPSDQYAINSASKQANNAFGNDWFYFGTVDNSVTGLSAFEAQGDAFALVNPPDVAGNDIRITGHGTDNTPNSTYNQVQQTHVGPFINNGGVLQYQADTTGGNSGSPIIWEQANAAIGVHTNAGCSTGGGGANQGTPITVAALQAALANPLGVCASTGVCGAIDDLGLGLQGQWPYAGTPEFSGNSTLEPGAGYNFTLLLPFQIGGTMTTALLILGFSSTNAPFHGGTLVPAPEVVVSLPADTIALELALSGSWPLGVPPGTEIYAQWWCDVDGLFADAIMASNALKLTTP